MAWDYQSLDPAIVRPLPAVTAREQAEQAKTRRAAALTVADRADGVDDCARLLDMLGLHPSEGRTP